MDSTLVMDQIRAVKKVGLCYNCNEKFNLGHRCKKLFLIEACLEEVCRTPKNSLHAIAGISALETVQVKGSLGHVVVTVLVDSGSTHNFVSEKLARKEGLQPVLGYDVVLGAQWLCTLEPIVWDFSKLQMRFHMRFHVNDKEVALQGLSVPENKVVSNPQIERAARKKNGALLQLFALGAPQLQPTTSSIPTQVQQLLEKYKEVLTEPKGLPPQRAQNHKIPQLPG
ncbi:hypothetical protein AMTRI_Chr06g175660 [Amborella trichopoda]